MFQSLNDNQKKYFFNSLLATFVILAILLLVITIDAIKQYSYIGQGVYAANVITVSGTGDVLAIPDVGTFSFTVDEKTKTVTDAQNAASTKVNNVISAIKAMGVADVDIQTDSYNSNPTYQYNTYPCPQPLSDGSSVSSDVSSAIIYPCSQGKNVLTGYEVSQSVSVKIRKTADAGAILTKVGSFNVSYISGLNFVVDNIDLVQAQARDKAIADAKAKAEVLAKSLGVSLDKVISFNESGTMPVYYGAMDTASIKGMGGGTVATPPQLPVGQNKITSNVSITYEIGQ